jgi:hypothetical protein
VVSIEFGRLEVLVVLGGLESLGSLGFSGVLGALRVSQAWVQKFQGGFEGCPGGWRVSWVSGVS